MTQTKQQRTEKAWKEYWRIRDKAWKEYLDKCEEIEDD